VRAVIARAAAFHLGRGETSGLDPRHHPGDVSLVAPLGEHLHVGTYEAAEGYPFQCESNPGLDFAMNHRACSRISGRFEVVELGVAAGQRVDRLHAFFEVHCRAAVTRRCAARSRW
jgi:hypothetical protein